MGKDQTKKMSIILKFSKFVCLPILTEWTASKDVLTLDTAFCNDQRGEFLKLIHCKNDGVFCFGTENLINNLKWICRKNINILHLTLKHPHIKSFWVTMPPKDMSLVGMLIQKLGLKEPCKQAVPFSSIWEAFNGTNKLTSLNLSQCYTLSDFILLDVTKNCSKLKVVNLSECSQITNRSVSYIASHNPDLRNLVLSHCHAVTDDSVIILAANCKGLTYLEAFDCFKLSDRAVDALALSCPDLQHLDLGVSASYRKQYALSTTGASLPRMASAAVNRLIAACPGLRHLDVDRCVEITLSTVKLLAGCNDLTTLRVGSLNLTCENEKDSQSSLEALVDFGSSCALLNTLHISSCRQLTDEQLSTLIRACPALTEAALIDFCEPNADETYSALCNCPVLTHLDLTGNAYLLDHHMTGIVHSIGPQLATLLLKDCDALAYVGFPSTSSSFCENLTKLDLSGIRHVNDSLVAKVATRCPKLNTLLLHHVYTLSYERGFNPIFTHLDSLHTLSIMVLMQPVYWVGLAKICERYGAQLTSLTVGYQKPGISLRSSDIAAIAKNCRNLTSLELVNFSLRGVSQSTLKHMFKKCDKLRKLSFSHTDITNKTVSHIAKHCHALSFLDLSGCQAVNDDALSALSKCASLTYLVLTNPMRNDVRMKYGWETITALKESRANLTMEMV